MTRRQRVPRGTLSAEQIVDAACDLVATGGLDGFSMPELARHLGVGVTSVYWYFHCKDDLIHAIADRVTEDFYAGLDDDTGLDGDDLVLRHFREYWARLRENALWREMLTSKVWSAVQGSPSAAARAGGIHERQLARMIDAGLSPSDAIDAYTIMSSYTRGYVLVDHLMHADASTPRGSAAVVRAFGNEERVEVARAAGALATDTFEKGLRALWSGLLLERSAPPTED
jgi:AcrR family transcriptional regulator